MKAPAIACLASLLAACTTSSPYPPAAAQLTLHYSDLDIATAPGRAELVVRLQRSAKAFCRSYDPQHDDAIHAQGLLSRRYCPAVAADMLARALPARMRRAYLDEIRAK